MGIMTNEAISPQGKLNQADIQRWIHNLLLFLIPVAIIYFLQLYATVQKTALNLNDIWPTAMTQGAIELYIINGLLDILRKYQDATK